MHPKWIEYWQQCTATCHEWLHNVSAIQKQVRLITAVYKLYFNWLFKWGHYNRSFIWPIIEIFTKASSPQGVGGYKINMCFYSLWHNNKVRHGKVTPKSCFHFIDKIFVWFSHRPYTKWLRYMNRTFYMTGNGCEPKVSILIITRFK